MIAEERRSDEDAAAMAAREMPLAVYAVTIFLSAFLLFQIEPMIAKMIVPWFGGSASVWTACLLFFQAALLLGYLYAHGSMARLAPSVRGRVHAGLLLVSLTALPAFITLRSGGGGHWVPAGTEEPTGRILLVLLATIGLPYFLLSTTGPLLQAWASRVTRPGRSPYRLYALSNAGSLLALLGYPFLVEPALTLRQQALTWAAAYIAFVALCGVIAWRQPRTAIGPSEAAGGDRDGARPGLGLHLRWVGLAAVPSVLLLAVTSHLSQNVAAIPFLWVLPLTLYLLSFIVCFGPARWEWKPAFLPLPALALGTMAYEYTQQFDTSDTSIQALVAVFALGLFVCCVLCHGELARLKPPPRYLTSFYLMMSIGGALGGVFVALVAPHVFPDYWEFPMAMGTCALVALFVLYREPRRGWWYDWQWLATAALTAGLIGYLVYDARDSLSPKQFTLTERSFYGVLRVKDPDDPTAVGATRTLTNGTINHGEQFVDPKRHMQPTTYYGPDSGVGLAIREAQTRGPARVGVIGLGTGTIAAFGRPGDWFQFYDINPQVIQVAHTQFSFLRDSRATVPPVVVGDARLSLEREASQQFDVLVVDAFAGDSIPIHLLTREAFALYFRHLRPGGVLAVHVTNLYLDLQPVVALSARAVGREARLVESAEDDDADVAFSDWMLVTGRTDFWSAPLLRNESQAPSTRRAVRLWTDDYSNLFQILKRPTE